MTTYGDRELEEGMSGDDVQELQVKLSGWYDVHPTWDSFFDNTTKDAVVRFQAAHNLPQTGKVDHWTYARIDNEAFDHFFSRAQYQCPNRRGGCKGFGTGRSSYLHTNSDGSKRTIFIDGGERPGVSKVLVWLVRGLMHRAQVSYTNDPGGGYRCSYYNEDTNKTTTNHSGEAIDLKVIRSDWSTERKSEVVEVLGQDVTIQYRDAARNFKGICLAAGIPDDVRAAGVIHMERHIPVKPGGYYAGTYVHLDVRTALDSVGGHPTEWYAKTYAEMNEPLYNGGVFSLATAEPPDAPPPPPPYSASVVEATAVEEATHEVWEDYYIADLERIESSSDALAGDTDPIMSTVDESPEELIILATETGVGGASALLYDKADTIESSRRSFILAQHTRDDYRSFGRITNDKLTAALQASNALFRRRFENYILPAEDCNA